MNLHTKNGQQITVEDQPFASGGEGAIHKVTSSNFQGCCVKMYFQQYRSKQKEQKIDYMIKNPPPNLQSNTYRICWAKELIYQNNQFVGFVMPLAFNGSNELYKLVLPKLKPIDFKNDFNAWQAKYDKTQQSGIMSRLKLCVNIAIAVHTIHSYQKYVFVDMKPINFLMTLQGNISVIDTDSMQIAHGNQVLFPAQVATPEYVPVEGNKLNPSTNYIPETWDRFSMAIIFYELLFGLHPYVASFKHPYTNTDAINSKIENGLFVYGAKKNNVLVLPPPHQNFNIIPQAFKDLFLRAFDSGHSNPAMRPSAENWGQVLYAELSKPQPQVQGHKVIMPSPPKQVITQPIQTPKQVIQQPQYQIVNYADFGIRFGATIVDFVAGGAFIFAGLVGCAFIIDLLNIGSNVSSLIALIATFYLCYIYWVKSITSTWQGTLGQKIVGIKVVDDKGGTITMAQAIGRNLGKLISIGLVGIGYLMPLWTDKKQTLHDQMAGTIVVKK